MGKLGIAFITGGEEIAPVDWTISDLLEDAAQRGPEMIAARQYDVVGNLVHLITFAKLLEVSKKVAHELAKLFAPGDSMGLWGNNSIGWLVFQMAAARLGAIIVTLDPALGEHELRYMLEKGRVAGVIMDRTHRGKSLPDLLGRIRSEFPRLRHTLFLDDWEVVADRAQGKMERSPSKSAHTALIVFTSGTTGRPKGVMVHHYGAVNNARASAFRTALKPGGAMLNPLPAYSIGGAATINLGAISQLLPQIIVPHFEPGLVLRLIATEHVSWMPLVPAMLIPMIEHPDFSGTDLSSLEAIWMGGTVITPEHARLARDRLGPEVQMIYGQTESGGLVTASRRGLPPEKAALAVGIPLSHATIRIADLATGETVARDVIGEIRLKSPYMTSGYFENPEATAGLFDEQGFMRSGDLGLVDEDGNVRITGRLKDLIIRGGRNIYPREIEDVIVEFPGVAEVAVVGVPHERWGEEVAAVLRCRLGAEVDIEALCEFLAARVASYKVPKVWRQVADFPRGGQGKIKKMELAALFAEAPVSG